MNILIKPVITEKSMNRTGEQKYTFIVHDKANKPEINHVLKEMYKVDVIKVNISRKKAEDKIVRGRFQAKIKKYKTAIVTLKKGQKISGFEIKENKE